VRQFRRAVAESKRHTVPLRFYDSRMVWVIAALCAVALLVIFVTMKKGTASIVLGSLILAGTVANLDRARSFSIAYCFILGAVVLLWGVSYKLEARYLTPAKNTD
jgi:hypothetical protein